MVESARWTDVAIAALTAVLAATTAYYAWQTRRTVSEMRLERAARWIPYLVISEPGASIAYALNGLTRYMLRIGVSNVGPGPAWITAQRFRDIERGELAFKPVPAREAPLVVPVGHNMALSASVDVLLLPDDDRDPRRRAPISWTIEYRDLVGENAYECRVDLDVRYDEAPRGIVDLSQQPQIELRGHVVNVTVTWPDARPPSQRRLARHAWTRLPHE